MAPENGPSPGAGADALRTRLESALADNDRDAAVLAALQAVDSGHVDVLTLYDDILTPLMVSVGDRWRSGDERVWQEHFATATVATIVEALAPSVGALAAKTAPCGKRVLVAAPALEQHVLGLRMVADIFRVAGWDVTYLGANVPSGEILEAAKTLRVDAVVMSASTTVERVGLRHVADFLEREIPGIGIWVGGAAFAREHEGWREDEILDLRGIEKAAREACAPPSEAP